ncbi:hypothetical protein A3Q56_05351 [Intoshia linei]|uniref:Uncharacterized protein n=1 Tax=Intoshia linei TaxID=1819745 RepID=A0A177AY49_9BILA|nr:hypothetical protein A3Q56_05351 [Intoshia linei]
MDTKPKTKNISLLISRIELSQKNNENKIRKFYSEVDNENLSFLLDNHSVSDRSYFSKIKEILGLNKTSSIWCKYRHVYGYTINLTKARATNARKGIFITYDENDNNNFFKKKP